MKRLFLVLCAVGSFITSNSQIRYGIKAGYNSSDLYFSGAGSISNVKSKSGFNAGVYSAFPLSKSLSIQPEIQYSEQGARYKDSAVNVNYNYLNVPVLAKYQLASGIFAESGPQIGFLLNSSYKSSTSSFDLMYSKSTAFSWVFGAGYKLPTVNLGIDIRYNLGISNIQTYSLFTTKNSVLQIDLFYELK
jgi:hypothetical protein